MTSFWVVAGILIVGALLFIIPTLLRKGGTETGMIRNTANVTIYRDQLAELEADLNSDVLTREQYEQSKRELQQRMLQDVPAGETMKAATLAGSNQRNVLTITLLVLAIPILAISLYLWVGNTRGLTPQAVEPEPAPMMDNAAAPGHQNFSSVLDNLTARLKDQPDDLEGWVMLGRTYAIMQRFSEARDAYKKVLALSPDNPEFITDYADIVAMTNNGSLIGEPEQLVNKALKLDANNGKALALAGTVEFEKKNYAKAAAHWEKLMVQIPPESKLAQSVRESIAEAKSLAGGGKGSSMMAGQQNQSDIPPPSSPGGNNAVAGAAAGKSTGTAGANSISGKVTISPSLAGKAAASDTLFIFARAKTGPKAPLAIMRLRATDLPATFSLTDAMAMIPEMKISNFPEVVVGARISKSGKAFPESGDLQGFSQPVSMGAKDLHIVIDQQVP